MRTPTYAGLFDKHSLEGLYRAEVIELEINIYENDRFEEPS